MLALLAAGLALGGSDASAGFRYVPPDTPPVVEDAAAEPAARGPIPLPAEAQGAEPGGPSAGPGPAVLGPRVPGPRHWRVREGEMLRAALARWGARAGVDVLFLTDRRYRLEAAASFEGRFMDAVQALFRGLSHLPHPPVAARAEGAALVVRHRLRGFEQEEEGR